MKLVSYKVAGGDRLGLLCESAVVDLQLAYASLASKAALAVLPSTMGDFLRLGEAAFEAARAVAAACPAALESWQSAGVAVPASDVVLLAPVPRPTSMRDGYAFRQHVEAARRNRGVEMIPEFDLFPIFYFTNHQAVTGPGEVVVQDSHLDKLDFELEAAIVIGKECRNVSAADADACIAGYMVMNDWSARTMQMEEMKLSLGPAKGKDFATSLGPWLVTKDELEAKRIPSEHGDRYDLQMTASVNGTQVSLGNLKDMTWTFAQIIERASYGVTLYPGDVIGSGTVGTGCFLELNGSKVFPQPWWLGDGDVVECAIDGLGTLSNTIRHVRG